MEKRRPTYDLNAFQAAAGSRSGLAVTTTAARSAFALGFDRKGMMEVIGGMRRGHFVKSMTSYADHAAWQDVYHVPSAAGTLYVKFTAGTLTEFVLLSFKEKTDG